MGGRRAGGERTRAGQAEIEIKDKKDARSEEAPRPRASLDGASCLPRDLICPTSLPALTSRCVRTQSSHRNWAHIYQ